MRTSPSKSSPLMSNHFVFSKTLCDSTWHIIETRHPVRNFKNDEELKHQLRVKLIILAEVRLHRLGWFAAPALEAMSRLIGDSTTSV
jgi:hypothetical protein